jgi:hypothetical protein
MPYRAAILAGGVALAALAASSANAAVLITVDKSTQEMTVQVDGTTRWQWKVSTGRSGHDTPAGTFKAVSMDADHYSKTYDNAPMPHAIFFTNSGHAIHGSFAVRRLGTPASHGCVRVEPANATKLFALVGQQGMKNTTIVITGNAADATARARTPAPAATAAPAAPPARSAAAAVTLPDNAAKIKAAPLTLAPQPPAQPSYRQAFLPNAEPPAPPHGYPPFPRPWNVASDLR